MINLTVFVCWLNEKSPLSDFFLLGLKIAEEKKIINLSKFLLSSEKLEIKCQFYRRNNGTFWSKLSFWHTISVFFKIKIKFKFMLNVKLIQKYKKTEESNLYLFYKRFFNFIRAFDTQVAFSRKIMKIFKIKFLI